MQLLFQFKRSSLISLMGEVAFAYFLFYHTFAIVAGSWLVCSCHLVLDSPPLHFWIWIHYEVINCKNRGSVSKTNPKCKTSQILQVSWHVPVTSVNTWELLHLMFILLFNIPWIPLSLVVRTNKRNEVQLKILVSVINASYGAFGPVEDDSVSRPKHPSCILGTNDAG